MKFRQLGYFVVLVLACAMAAHATTVQFELEFPLGDRLSNMSMYTAGGFTITAFGYDGTRTAVNLYGKALGEGEDGLGLVNDPSGDHEISGSNYIEFDLSSLLNNPGLAMEISSVTGIDTFQIWGSDTFGSPFDTLLFSGAPADNETLIALTGALGGYDFYTVDAPTGNVLVDSIQASSATPEPGTLVMFGSGIVALAGVLRRKLTM